MKTVTFILVFLFCFNLAFTQVETKNPQNGLTILLFSNGTWTYKSETGSFTDSRDGKTYRTIRIGTQVWMAENLAYKTNEGCWTFGNDTSNVNKYGYLYTWETARKICPTGWHLPSDDEWTVLVNYLGGEEVAGKKLKNDTGWIPDKETIAGTNESSFCGNPGGYRLFNDGTYGKAGKDGIWWSSTAYNSENAWRHDLYYTDNKMYRWFSNMGSGFSIRCVKD